MVPIIVEIKWSQNYYANIYGGEREIDAKPVHRKKSQQTEANAKIDLKPKPDIFMKSKGHKPL